ncbi:MAG: sugar ABC transporter ATP-binding protein [Spirochaetia bacterium]|nr:sugar ABC transporter ATP-binding protein [Spirochaetia bacterium]
MIVETKHLTKVFGSMYALNDINFSIKKGEIHGLVGENGAGKSTLIKILTGVYSLTEGEIYVNGELADIKDPVKSRDLGINVIHQDRHLIPSFNGIENIFLGLPYEKKKNKVSVDFNAMRAKIEVIMDKYGIEVPLNLMAKELSPPQQTLIEIIRAMLSDCKLLILDEPTAALTDKETIILFDIIKKLNKAGTAILYVTHRMDEIFALTDRITVFRNGEMVETVLTKNTTKDDLISAMTDNDKSKEKASTINHDNKELEQVLFSVKNIATKDKVVKDASFEVHKGEILGIFGLGGSGRTELLEGIYGYKSITNGEVFYKGKRLEKLSPKNSINNGIGLIHEDRRGHSLVINRSIKNNVVLPIIDSYVQKGLYNSKKENSDVNDKIQELNIKAVNNNQKVAQLSGGNQQKVVFAKSLIFNPEVFLCDEPTQAVDIMTRSEIHTLLRAKAAEGKAIVYVTSDLLEMLEIADNILIMANGKTHELINNNNVDSKTILQYCYKER